MSSSAVTAAKENDPFADWQWPAWPDGVNHPVLMGRKDLNFVGGMEYIASIIITRPAPALVAELGDATISTIRSWKIPVTLDHSIFENDTSNLAIFQKGAIMGINNIREAVAAVPNSGDANLILLGKCLDALERDVHWQFVWRTEIRAQEIVRMNMLQEVMVAMNNAKKENDSKEGDKADDKGKATIEELEVETEKPGEQLDKAQGEYKEEKNEDANAAEKAAKRRAKRARNRKARKAKDQADKEQLEAEQVEQSGPETPVSKES